MSGRILVTGATGLVGGALARRLASEGAPARALVRREVELPVELARGDLADDDALARACDGVECVIHCAARAGDTGKLDDYRADNVDGTARLLRAAERAGVARFVFLSSISVYGFHPPGIVDEDTPVDAPRAYPYAVSKVEAERAVREAGLEHVVVRVGSVYGPGSHHWTVRPVELMKQSPLGMPLVDGGRGLHNAVYLDNLTDGLLLCARHPAAANETLLLVDETLSYRAFFAAYARMLGQEKFVDLGHRRALALAAVLERAARLRGKQPKLTTNAVRLLMRKSEMRADKARTSLGWTSRVPFDEAMASTEAWLRAEGYL